MAFRILAIARDFSVLLLGIEIFAILLIPILVLLYVTRGLRSFIPQVAKILQELQSGWFRLASYIDRAMRYIRAPFLWIASKSDGLKVFLSRMKPN